MEGYGYPEPAYPGPADRYPEPKEYEYYDMVPISEDHGDGRRPSRSKRSPNRQNRKQNRSPSTSASRSRSRSRSTSNSRSKSRTNVSGSKKNVGMRQPSFMDAFRVMYLTPSKHKKNNTKFLATQKREDHIHELLKADRLGSKRWLFYPRSQTQPAVPEERESCDQRIKVDGEFFRKYKRTRKVDLDAPIAKLKRWELILYQKLGFIQAV